MEETEDVLAEGTCTALYMNRTGYAASIGARCLAMAPCDRYMGQLGSSEVTLRAQGSGDTYCIGAWLCDNKMSFIIQYFPHSSA